MSCRLRVDGLASCTISKGRTMQTLDAIHGSRLPAAIALRGAANLPPARPPAVPGTRRAFDRGEELFAEGEPAASSTRSCRAPSAPASCWRWPPPDRCLPFPGRHFRAGSRRQPSVHGRGGRRRGGDRLPPQQLRRRWCRRSGVRRAAHDLDAEAASTAPTTTWCCSAARPRWRRWRASCSTWPRARPGATSIELPMQRYRHRRPSRPHHRDRVAHADPVRAGLIRLPPSGRSVIAGNEPALQRLNA